MLGKLNSHIEFQSCSWSFEKDEGLLGVITTNIIIPKKTFVLVSVINFESKTDTAGLPGAINFGNASNMTAYCNTPNQVSFGIGIGGVVNTLYMSPNDEQLIMTITGDNFIGGSLLFWVGYVRTN